MPIRALLVDDEELARRGLRVRLERAGDIAIVGECANGRDAITAIGRLDPDLVFLDVQMPELSGFDVIDAIGTARVPYVIFVTAYDQYAVRAFEIHAVDYLLKPFTAERLRSAVQRVRDHAALVGLKTNTALNQEGSTYTTRMVFKSRGRILFLPVDEIRWIAAEENYVRICAGNESHLLRDTMARLETRLDPNVFLRVHRSSIVNLHYVKEVKNQSDGESLVVLKSGEQVAMSRSYRARIYKLLHH